MSYNKNIQKKSQRRSIYDANWEKTFHNQQFKSGDFPWTDNLFPPNNSSILGEDYQNIMPDKLLNEYNFDIDKIEWKRISEIFPEPTLYEAKISAKHLSQGTFCNSYFTSIFESICHYPSLITEIFLDKEYNKKGYYRLRLFIDGEFQIVYLDDYFPVYKGTKILVFTKTSSFEIWPILLEKAWAKINGGYLNIIKGWSSEFVKAITSFPCENMKLQLEDSEKIWTSFKTATKKFGVIICTSINSKDIEAKGLIPNYSYALIEILDVKAKSSKEVYRLCKLKNTWGICEWKGDFSKDSSLWGNVIIEQDCIDLWALKNGEFWVTLEELCKYFIRCDICYLLFGGNCKVFNFKNNELNTPKVLNIYIPKESITSVSLLEKNWRYNKELKNVSHPTSLIIAQYDPNSKSLSTSYCNFECYEDTEKIRNLEPGFYLIWAYKPNDISQKPEPEFMSIRIISDCAFNAKFVCNDTNFQILSEIIKECVKYENKNNIKNNEFFYDIKNNFNNSGIGYRLIINPLSTEYQKWKVNTSKVEGFKLLPPYNKSSDIELGVGPCSSETILGIQTNLYEDHWFKLSSNVLQFKCKDGKNPIISNKISFDDFCLGDLNSGEVNYEYSYPRLNDYTNFQRATISHDIAKAFIDKYKEKYPKLMDFIEKLEPINLLEGDKSCWNEIDTKQGKYIGESDNFTFHGRGCFIFKEDNSKWVGYWNKGKKTNFGKLYDRNDNLIFEGQYRDGYRNGKGIYYYPNGDKFEGNFNNGLGEGKGVYYWKNGSKWIGNFKNNLMDGHGDYYDKNGETYPVFYKLGELIDN